MSNHGLPLRSQAFATMNRLRELMEKCNLLGKWSIEHWRKINNQPVLLGIYDCYNDITNEGKLDILGVYFHSDTQTATGSWCIGLINASGYTALNAADVMSSHTGWTEYVNYSQSTRVAWAPGASSSNSITNATPAQFDMITGSGTVKGIFITNNNAKSGTSGKLWSTALFASDVPVNVGDQLKSTYTLSC